MSTPSSRVFPARLLEARTRLRLTQAEVGERAGLQAAAVNHFEAGRRSPSFDNLKRLADALEVSVDYLLGRTDIADPANLNALDPEEAQFRDKRSKLSSTSRDMLNDFIDLLSKKEQERRKK